MDWAQWRCTIRASIKPKNSIQFDLVSANNLAFNPTQLYKRLCWKDFDPVRGVDDQSICSVSSSCEAEPLVDKLDLPANIIASNPRLVLWPCESGRNELEQKEELAHTWVCRDLLAW